MIYESYITEYLNQKIQLVVEIKRSTYNKLQDKSVNSHRYASECIDAIQAGKTIQKGEWIETTVRGSMSLVCSKCGADLGSICETNFCPNCGANMRESENKE